MAQKDGLSEFRKSINETNKLFAELSNRIIKLKQNGATAEEIISKLSGKMNEATGKFRATTAAIRANQNSLNKTSKDYKQSTDAVKNLNSGMNNLDNQFKKATKSQSTFGSEFKKQFSGASLGKATGNLLKYVGAFRVFSVVLNAVKNVTVAAAKANIEYEAQLANLEAVTGATSNEMNMLSENILQVAGSTKFTSSEIVKLQTSLGKLGFSTQEIIDATQAIANVAQALGQDAAPVAEKVGQILNQFNLTASESVQVGDVLVSTINNSALSFQSFGTAIQYVGPLAAELGTSFTDLSGAMAILADSGFTASRIGTGLRGILTELGTSGEDLQSIIRNLADEEISFAESVELVGKRSAAQLLTLVDNIDILEEAEDRYEETGAAIVASAKQIDTFKGNTELLNSAWNAFLINLGEFYNRSGLVKSALRLLNEEAADTAEGLGIIADVKPEAISAGFDSAIFTFKQLTAQGVEYSEALRIAQITASSLIAEESFANDEIMKDLKERKKITEERLADETRSLQIRKKDEAELKNINKEIKDLTAEKNKQVLTALESELEGQILNEKLQTERNKIAKEYKDIFDGLVVTSKELKDQADKQTLTEKERLSFNKKVEEEIAELKERKAAIEEGELKSLLLKQKANIELTDEERLQLNVLSAQAEALDTQIGKFRNLEVIQGTQKKNRKSAEESFNEQIKGLNLLIDRQKKLLKDKLKQNELEREAVLNNLKNAKTEEEREKLQRRLVGLESDNLATQKSSFLIINDLIENFKQQLSEAGLSAKKTEEALKKIEKIEFKVGDLDVDLDEFGDVAKNLAKGFEAEFGKQLKEGDDLTEEQKKYVQKFLNSLFESFGENITDEQKGIITELVFSKLYGDENAANKKAKKAADEAAKSIKASIEDILKELGEVFDEYNETYLENKTSRLEAELEAVKRTADIEQDILQAQLNNQLIADSQFRTKSLELQKNAIAKENSINKKIFDAEKASDLRIVGAETAEALASNILNNYEKYDFTTAGVLAILSSVAVGAAGLAKADAIRRRQFTPVQFEEGGIVQGPSHAEGGIPFTVQGRGGYEMEGGEFIINKKAASLHRSLLEKINNSTRVSGSYGQYAFANGGAVPRQADESVDYLKAIAEATASTAIQASKPVRAFVSSKDLRSNETERRLRDRNDRI
jgi:hypothetical protein